MLCGPAAADFPNLRYNDISFQYLEIRYNSRLVRTLASLSYVIASVASTGIALYAPCLSLRTVTGLPLVGLVLMAGLIATFYTVLVCIRTPQAPTKLVAGRASNFSLQATQPKF